MPSLVPHVECLPSIYTQFSLSSCLPSFLRQDPHLQGNENRQVEHHKLYKTDPEVVAKPSRFGGAGRYGLRLWAGKLCDVTVKPCQGCAWLEPPFASTIGIILCTHMQPFSGEVGQRSSVGSWSRQRGGVTLVPRTYLGEVKMCSLCIRSDVLDQSPEIDMQNYVTGVVSVMSSQEPEFLKAFHVNISNATFMVSSYMFRCTGKMRGFKISVLRHHDTGCRELNSWRLN